MIENTLMILKPDIIERKLVGAILKRVEDKGLTITRMKTKQLSYKDICEHYNHLIHKPFFSDISSYMMSNQVVLVWISGENAISVVRTMTGASNPETQTNFKSQTGLSGAPGTLRGDFALNKFQNGIHASDSNVSADKELSYFFG